MLAAKQTKVQDGTGCCSSARQLKYHKNGWPRTPAASSTSTITGTLSLHTGSDGSCNIGADGGSNGDHASCFANKTVIATLGFFLHRQPSYGGLLQFKWFVQSPRMEHQNNHSNFTQDHASITFQGLQGPKNPEHYSPLTCKTGFSIWSKSLTLAVLLLNTENTVCALCI